MKKIIKRGIIWWPMTCAVAGIVLLYVHFLSRFSYYVSMAGIFLLALLLCIWYAWVFDRQCNEKRKLGLEDLFPIGNKNMIALNDKTTGESRLFVSINLVLETIDDIRQEANKGYIVDETEAIKDRILKMKGE